MTVYIVFDGRALFDVDAAEMLDYMGEYPSDEMAMADARNSWAGHDAILIGYRGDTEELNEIVYMATI